MLFNWEGQKMSTQNNRDTNATTILEAVETLSSLAELDSDKPLGLSRNT